MIDSNNQQTFQQDSHVFRDSEVENTIIDFEGYLGSSQKRGSKSLATETNDEGRHERVEPKSRSEDSNNRELSVLRQESGQSDELTGISYVTDLSIADHGYVGDLSKVATGSGNIETPQLTSDNQGHNYFSNSNINQKLIVIIADLEQ